MRARRGLLAALAALALPATAASAQEHDAGHGTGMAPPGSSGPASEVKIGFGAFSPGHADVLVGDSVHWTNVSVRTHTVTARDGSFDSGRLQPGADFRHRFAAPGTVPYFCRLHPIPGEVDVHRLLLGDLGPAGTPGGERTLSGRTALPEGAEVVVERDEGTGFAPVATALVDATGAVRTTLRPQRTATYRLVSGADVSPARTLVVVDRRLTISARPQQGRRTRIEARVTPASPGVPAVLQLRLPHRFGWWPVARARVGRDARVRFSITRGRRVPARIVLTLPDGATVLASSPVVHVGGR